MALIDRYSTQAVRKQRQDNERQRKTIACAVLWLLAIGAFLALYAASWLLVPPLAA